MLLEQLNGQGYTKDLEETLTSSACGRTANLDHRLIAVYPSPLVDYLTPEQWRKTHLSRLVFYVDLDKTLSSFDSNFWSQDSRPQLRKVEFGLFAADCRISSAPSLIIRKILIADGSDAGPTPTAF